MAEWSEIKTFNGQLNTDDAPEYLAEGDYVNAVNIRGTGTAGKQQGYGTGIESNTLLTGSLPTGIDGCNGGSAFEDIRQAVLFRPNSAGNNQILLYNYDTNSYTVIYEDVTNSGGIPLLPLDPQQWVTCILINKTYLIWTAKNLEVGYTNLNTLKSGGYGTLLWEDLSLIKPQCMPPPTGTYGSDGGQPANFWFGVLPQATVQYVNDDYNYSAWSTRSKRIVPYQQNTPTLGTTVAQNNYIVWAIPMGSIRATTVNIAVQYDNSGQFYQIKSVARSYVTALPNTSVNVATEIYEAYDPTSNTYYFVDYNNEAKIAVDKNETNLFYDYIWFGANACEVLNGNIASIADWTIPYSRVTIPVTITANGYNPNIAIPIGTYTNSLTMSGQFYGASGSGAGSHRRIIYFTLSGSPATGDKIVITTRDIRNATMTYDYSYVVPSAQNGNLAAVVASITAGLPSGSYVNIGSTYTITFIGLSYQTGLTLGIQLYFAGASVANSIPSVLDNTQYQLALSLRDKQGRPFPLITDNTYKFTTPSYAQVNGQAIQISANIGSVTLPSQAVDAQWLITAPTPPKILDTMATPLVYQGAWDSKNNSPSLSVNMGGAYVGYTYQVTTPCSPADTSHYTNLGKNDTYNTGDYIVYNGQSWDLLDKSFGDLTATGNIMAFSLNPLKMLNDAYSQEGVNTLLGYDFAANDRCTLQYFINSGVNTFFNSPCIDLEVLGYDAGNYLVKVEKSAALSYSSPHISYNGTNIDGTNVFIRLYSPGQTAQSTSAVSNSQVWYEIGERFTITNQTFDKTVFTLVDGGVYYKTRQFPDAPAPYANSPHQTLATDLNYSDFYSSAYWSQGRARAFNDVLVNTEQKAEIIPSNNYIVGSLNNGLNRFYPQNIYGDGDGQTSSSKGAIQVLWQRGDILVVIQERSVFFIPVNYTWTIVNDEVTGTSLSDKLLNTGRYSAKNIGIGTAKESFCRRYDMGYFLDPNNSLPMQIGLDGTVPIPGKMSKYFKAMIQAAYAIGKKLVTYYDTYYEEVVVAIQSSSNIIKLFMFDNADWNPNNSYVIAPSAITANNGSHSTVSYNSTTGIATYTPSSNYVGTDNPSFTFNPGGGTVTVYVPLQWTAGVTTVNPFSFSAVTNALLSTAYTSNSILVNGPTVPVSISITGGTYSINGGAYTSSSGTTNPGDTITVKQTSSGSNSTTTNAVLTIGSTSGTFAVTTQASTPAYNVNVYNNSSSVVIVGGSVGSTLFGYVNPGGYTNLNVSSGTYTVTVKTGAGGTRYVNCTGQAEQNGGSGFTAIFTGVVISSSSITVIDIQDTP